MRILIVDDTKINHTSANLTLAGHEVVHARTKEEAIHLLTGSPSSEWISTEMERRGISFTMEARKQVEGSFLPPAFDAVLLDLFMPPGGHASAAEKAAGLIPCGLPLAMMAARIQRVKYVLVATSANHHDGALVRMVIDDVRRTRFQINQARVVFREATMVERYQPESGKNWGGMLTELMDDDDASF